MQEQDPIKEMHVAVGNLITAARRLYEASENIPAVNRNTKRLLASLEMLKINLEEA